LRTEDDQVPTPRQRGGTNHQLLELIPLHAS
jgi:hypothetical protein